MKKATFLAALVSASVFVLSPTRSSATTFDDCQFAISTLTAQTAAATYLRGDLGLKLESQLLHHLAQASDELTKLDTRDALKQMDGYSTDLSRGVNAAKIESASATDLQLGANAVVACINAIGQ